MTSNKYRVMKKVVVAAALAGGVSCVASAGDYHSDNSDSRLGGDSYVYFNAARSNVSVDPAWRLSHTNGLTQSEFQARVSAAFAQRAHEAVFSKVADDPAWRPSHPGGLSDGDLQALSSEGPAWHSGPAAANTPPSVALQPSTGRIVHFSDPSN